jgi:hypothetical protein
MFEHWRWGVAGAVIGFVGYFILPPALLYGMTGGMVVYILWELGRLV